MLYKESWYTDHEILLGPGKDDFEGYQLFTLENCKLSFKFIIYKFLVEIISVLFVHRINV